MCMTLVNLYSEYFLSCRSASFLFPTVYAFFLRIAYCRLPFAPVILVMPVK